MVYGKYYTSLDESGSCSFSLAFVSHVVACVCVCCLFVFMLMSNDTLNGISVINVNDLIYFSNYTNFKTVLEIINID